MLFCELINYICIMTCLKSLRVIIVPLEVSCIVSSIGSIILWFIFSCKCFIWVDLAHACTMFWLSLSHLCLYDHLVFDLLCHFMLWSICFVAMHDYGLYALLVGRIQSFASLHLYWVWALLVHPTTKKTKFAKRVHHIYLFVVFPCHFPSSLLMCYL